MEAFNHRQNSKINESILKSFMEGLEIDLPTSEQVISWQINLFFKITLKNSIYFAKS